MAQSQHFSYTIKSTQKLPAPPFPIFKVLLNTQKYLKGQLPISLLSGDYTNMMCLSPIVSSENPPVSSVFCLDWDGMQLMAVTFMVA